MCLIQGEVMQFRKLVQIGCIIVLLKGRASDRSFSVLAKKLPLKNIAVDTLTQRTFGSRLALRTIFD